MIKQIFSHTPSQLFAYSMQKLYMLTQIDFPFSVPPSIILEPTNSCNLNCTGCQKDTKIKDKIGFLDINNATYLLSDIGKYLSSVLLNGFGETLLYPHFRELIRFIHSTFPKTKIIFFTNGLLLNESLAEFIIQEEVYEIYFSLDSASSSTYKKIRGGNFLLLIENIKKLNEIKKRQKKSYPLIKACFTIMEENKNELKDYFGLVHSLGIEPGLINIVNTKWGYTGEQPDIDVLQDAYNICQKVFPELNMNSIFPMLRQYSRPICPLPFVPYIAWNGDLKPCCYMTISNEYPLGNVFSDSFRKVWHNQSNRQFRSELLNNRFLPFCHDCTRILKDTM